MSAAVDQRYLNALQRRRAAIDAKDDLLTFTKLMKPDPDHSDDATRSTYQVALHHRAIAAALEQVEAGKIKRLIINCAPRHGKSELASRMFPAWYAGRHPADSIILATYSDKLSWDFGREVRAIMEDPIYSQVFPDMALSTASVDRIETNQQGKIFFVGKMSAITGRGANCLIIDDALKDRVEADSLTTRKKLWEWFNQVAKTRLLSSVGSIVIIGTRWVEDDLIGRLTDKLNPDYSPAEGRKWKIIDLPALAKSNKDVLGRKQGEALWPERFPVAYLEDMRAADPRGFQALYQGSPTPEKGNFFPADSLKTYTRNMRPPNDKLRFYAASDHAVSLSQARDKTCLMVIGVDDENNLWVMEDLVWGHLSTSLMVERMIDLMAKYKPIIWWAERGHISKSIGPFLRKRMLERGTFAGFCEVTAVHDKQTRAQAIRGRIEMGMVYFPASAPWWMEARQEILQFPHGVRDDVVDTLALVGVGLVTHAPPIARRKGKPEPKTGSLGWVRQDSDRQRKIKAGAHGQGW
jgi:predicted phage terminase large subunit-like protein